MVTYPTTEPACSRLLDTVVQTLFRIIPEDGLSLAVLDKQGNCWTSHPAECVWLSSDETLLHDLIERIDDGNDPAVMSVNDMYVVASQLLTDKADYGYSLLLLPKRNADSILQNWDLIELTLRQITLNIELLERGHTALC